MTSSGATKDADHRLRPGPTSAAVSGGQTDGETIGGEVDENIHSVCLNLSQPFSQQHSKIENYMYYQESNSFSFFIKIINF